MNAPEKTIVDNFGRVHDYLRISITDRCNLRCFYCMPESGIDICEKSKIMNFEEIIAISKVFVNMGVNKIRLTGGEPFIRKDIHVILNELSKLPVDLRITTNGILLDKHIHTLKTNQIHKVNISLDTLHPEKFKNITHYSFFEKTMSNIHLMIQEGFDVKINVVAMNGVNDDEVIDFVQWTENLPIQVRFIEFMPFNGNKWEWGKTISYKKLYEKIAEHFSLDSIEKINDLPNDTALNYKIKSFKGSFAFINSITQPFCSTCNRIRLTADGKIKNCLFSSEEADILTAYRNQQDIAPLILKNIYSKKEIRAGMNTFNEIKDHKRNQLNRSMVAIGG